MTESESVWYKIAEKSLKAGVIQGKIDDPILEILKMIITEEQARFILKVFDETSLSIDQIKERIGKDITEEILDKKLKELMHIGYISGIPSRRTGKMVYRIIPFFPGLLEYTLMRGEKGEREVKIARIWEKIGKEGIKSFQNNFDENVSRLNMIKDKIPSADRIIPVEQEIEMEEEISIPYQAISKILEEAGTIGVSTCYCRHKKDLVDESCKTTNLKENCFTLGRVARFNIEQEFAKEVTLEEAKEIFKISAEEGLLIRTFHTNLDINREISGICNCCKCCCGSIEGFHKGSGPFVTLSSFMAEVEEEECIGCGLCEEKCPMEAIDLNDGIAVVNENRCIGCGLCAFNCTSEAIHLTRTDIRKVFVPPIKIEN